MSKGQTNTHLRYGQGILIKGYNVQSDGVLTAKGFADIRALFQTYDDILYFKNYRNSIFQILPASSFDINDELKYIVENNLAGEGSNIKMLQAKAVSQKNQFQLNIESKNKELVCFGDEVVFKHIDSETYLSGTISPSDGTSGAFLVEVTKDLKSNLTFKLLPYRSFESQSNPIPLQSPVLIQNILNKGFLTFEKFGIAQKKDKNLHWDKSPIKSDQSYRIPIKTDSTSSEVFDCVTHFTDLSIENEESKMPWKFQLHFNDVDNDQLVQHDIVYFQHTENNGVLATIGEEQIVLKQFKGEKTSQLSFFDCLWEIQEHKLVSQHSYILRHLMSGMTLGVDVIKSTETKIRPKLVDISDGKGDGTIDNLGVIQLKLAKKEGGVINSQSYINICSGEMCLDIRKQKSSSKREADHQILDHEASQHDKKSVIDGTKFTEMSANQFDFDIKRLEFTLDVSKHCFVIQEIKDDLKSEVLFALSFHSRLIKLRQDLKWGAQESQQKVSYLRMMQITSKVREIKYFLKKTTIDDPNKEFKRPIQKRQIICYHLGISELLFELLFFIRVNLDGIVCKEGQLIKQDYTIFKNKPNQYEKLIELYNAIYQVIFELIRDNYQFKVHVTKWVEFIIEDVIRYGYEYILKTLLELLNKNKFFVNHFVTQDLVSYLVKVMPDKSLLKETSMRHLFHERKYIQIFRAFCICGGQVYSENQVLILNKFIKKLPDDDYSIYDIKIAKKKNKEGNYDIFCEAAVDKQSKKQRRFEDYYKICRDEYSSAWEYLVSFLNLIADMVQGRNKTVESYVETLLTAETLSDLLSNNQLFEVQAPIIRIIHYLYAESQKFYPIDRVTRVIDYDSLDEEAKLNSTKSVVRPVQAIGPVMETIISKLKNYGPIRVEDVAGNEKLYVILDFLRQTFQLGFWEDRKSVQQIFLCIKKLISPPEDINYNQIRQQSQKRQVVLMISCKQKCLEILDHIIDLDIDYNLIYFSKTFKKFQIPAKKINIQISNFLQVSEQCNFAVDFYNQYKSETESIKNMVSNDICSIMIELSKHSHPTLTSYSLRVVQRMLDMDSKIADHFSNLIFVLEEDRKNLYNYIEKRRDKFFTLEYQNTTKVNMLNQKSHYFMMYKDDTDAGIMQDLYMISELVKNQNKLLQIKNIKTLDSSRTFKELATEKLINFTSQRRSSNKMKQQIVDASNIHQKVLRYILNCTQIPQQLAKKLLHLCYKFLVSIIENNQNLKLTMIQYIPQMIPHIKQNLGCIDFLKEMYDNNRNMLYNQSEILCLIKRICNTIEEQELTFGCYKSKLLDFFRYLIYCNGRALKYNQIQILKIMQDDSYHNILLTIEKSRIQSLVTQFQEVNYQQFEDEDQIRSIKMQPELVYITTLFQIMVSLIDDKCKVNMGKLIKKFPFQTLVQWIQISSKCWPLKRNIRAFLNRLYYFEPEIETYMNTIIKEEIENIIKDLNFFIEIKSKTNSSIFEAQPFQNPVRFSYIESYLYLNLEENLFTLHQLIKKHELLEGLKDYLHSKNSKDMDGPYAFIRISQRLGWIRNYFSFHKNIYTTSFIKHLLKQLRDIICEFDDNVYAKGMMFAGQRMPSKSEKDRERKIVIERIMQGQITSFYVQGSPQRNKNIPLVYLLPPKIVMPPDEKIPDKSRLIKKLRQILTKTKVEFKNRDDEIYHFQEKIISALQISMQVKQQFIRSYYLKLNALECGPTGIQDYVSSIISINSENPNAFSPELKLFFLKMVIGIIQQANKTNMETKKPLDEWQSEDWEDYKKDIEKKQITLKKCNLQIFISELLREKIEDNIPLANQILLCGIAFLLGGNQVTQKILIDEILKYDDNRVFRNIALLISKLGKLILKNIDEKNFQPTSNEDFQITTIDNYDFYEANERYCWRKNVIEESSTNQVIYYRECIVTYRRAFRFLHLLCQNNNIANKHIMREQQKKLQSVNFITVATNQLRNLFSVMCKSIIEVPLFLLEFLNDVTQIPIKQNQEALTNSSFFEDICQMNNEFNKPGQLSNRNFDEGSNPLQHILAKTLSIILSNFEGNDEKIYLTVDTKIQPKFLVNIMESKLQSLSIKNKDDLLVYIKNSLQTQNQKGQKVMSPYYGEQLMQIFDIMIIFIKLSEGLKQSESRLYKNYVKYKKSSPEKEEMFEYLQKCLINIEVNDGNKKQTIYFPKQPAFYSLSSTTRDYIMGEVTRDTHRDKIVSLFGYIISLKDNLEYSYHLKKTEGLSESNMQNNYKIAAGISIVICIYLMLFYHVIIQYGQAQFGANRIYRSILFFLSLTQLSFSVIYFLYWHRLRIWYQLKKISNETEVQLNHPNVSQDTSKQKDKLIEKIKKFFTGFLSSQQAEEPEQTFYNSSEFYRILAFLLVSFLGTFYIPTIFFIHIIDIFCQAQMLASIFKAIAVNIKSLLYVSFMGTVFVVIFCTVTFSNYMKNVYQAEDPDNMCHSMIDCILTLYISGVIGEMEQFEVTRFFYDLIYSTFFGILFSNIVSGIMLDSFASMRQRNAQLTYDKSNKCYICNITRQKLQKKSIKFDHHTRKVHFLWNYVFYLIYLRNKSSTDYTGLQYEINKQYRKTDEDMLINWLPNGQDSQADYSGFIKDLIGITEQFQQLVTNNTQSIEEKVNDFNEKIKAIGV